MFGLKSPTVSPSIVCLWKIPILSKMGSHRSHSNQSNLRLGSHAGFTEERWTRWRWETDFSVQRLHGYRQGVQHALHCKSINFQITTQGRLLSQATKENW
jgi:hypothetical protein